MIDTVRFGDIAALRCLPAHATREPVLFVHGYFADATVWNEWLPFFAGRGFPAYAVHLRGRAGSGPQSGPGSDLGAASVLEFVHDAERVAKAIGMPAVIGHSMGGLIAQKLAERGSVRAAALVTPAPPRGITVMSPKLAIKQLKYLPAIMRSRPVFPSREDLRYLVLNRVPAAQQDAILDTFVPDSGRAGRDMSVTGFPVDAKAVRVPMFVITADEDHFIPRPIAVRIAARYSAPIQTMIGHGHFVIMEPGWQTVADAVARWLESV
jgi:pimeloyl-ACP methyl ester carboxylesterase